MQKKEDIKKKIDDYFSLEKEIHIYFGYQEDWCAIPLEDRRTCYWVLEQDASGGGSVLYSEKPLTKRILEEGNYYQDEIYTQRFLSKWVYEAKDFTLICVDTHTDGNKFLAIYSNDLRRVL